MAGKGTWFTLTDVQFSVVALTTETGGLTERVAYDAYGRARHRWFTDLDGDGDSDVNDFNAQAAAATSTIHSDPDYRPDADHDRDGDIDGNDYFTFLPGGNRAALAYGLISDPLGPDSPIGYDGYVLAPEAGLVVGSGGDQPQALGAYCVRFRWYLPETGRWLEKDPAGYLGHMSLFLYSASSPAAYSDPSGLAPTNFLKIGRYIVTRGGVIFIGVELGIMAIKDHEQQSRGINYPGNADFQAMREALHMLEDCAQISPGSRLAAAQDAFDLVDSEHIFVALSMENGMDGLTNDDFDSYLGLDDADVMINITLIEAARMEERLQRSGRSQSRYWRTRLAITLIHEAGHALFDTTEMQAYEIENGILQQMKDMLEHRKEQLESGDDCTPQNACLGDMSLDDLHQTLVDIENLLQESHENGARYGYTP